MNFPYITHSTIINTEGSQTETFIDVSENIFGKDVFFKKNILLYTYSYIFGMIFISLYINQ